VAPPEAEFMLRLVDVQIRTICGFGQHRRQIDREARAFTLRLVVALVVAFSAGFWLGKLWR
jgi:hypothetical protein